MRKLLCLVLLAACELKPPPKQQPAPSTPPVTTPTRPATPPPVVAGGGAAAGTAAGAAAPKVAISGPCMEVAAKVAQVFIDSAKDTAQKNIYEQERANMTRRTGEACTAQAWSDAARACYLKSKTPADLKACEMQYMPPPPAKEPPPTEG